MSLWGVHVGFAVVTTALFLLLVAPGYRHRWLVLAASGTWAVVPDFYHAMWAVPRLQGLWARWLHETALADLFWLHRAIDRADPGDSLRLSLAMWVLVGVVLLGSELVLQWRGELAAQ